MLLEHTVKYAVDSEAKAKELIESFRMNAAKEGFTIKKAGYEYKTKKSKGEIIGEKWVVTVTETFGDLWGEIDNGIE